MENTSNCTITLGGQPIHTIGKLPEIGSQAIDFSLTNADLKEETLSDYQNNVFHSI